MPGHKKLKTKARLARYENPTINLVFQSCQTFAENYFTNFILPKIGTFYMITQVKTQFSLGQKNFLVL